MMRIELKIIRDNGSVVVVAHIIAVSPSSSVWKIEFAGPDGPVVTDNGMYELRGIRVEQKFRPHDLWQDQEVDLRGRIKQAIIDWGGSRITDDYPGNPDY